MDLGPNAAVKHPGSANVAVIDPALHSQILKP